ncbi:MAG: hypothetical protein Q8J65_04425 [Nitrosomonadales bacterium]|nr:hypothetical protein [Nitrosomonadales bacterium]
MRPLMKCEPDSQGRHRNQLIFIGRLRELGRMVMLAATNACQIVSCFEGVKMRNATLKLAVLGVFGYSAYAFAAPGFTALPTTTPFPHPTVTGATTAYVTCNNTGDFGSGLSIRNPTTSPANECYHTPNPATDLTSPLAGYTLVASANRTVTLNNVYSGNTNKNIGTVLDVVWRKPAATVPVTPTPMCIYGTKFTATLTDYNTIDAGNQYFEANGIARGGFIDTGTSTPRDVEVAYSRQTATSEVLFRAGRTFTSVQHRPSDVDVPQTGLGSFPSINGKDSNGGNATAAQQLADVHDNWVEFTTDINARDDDGTTTASSHMFYVKTTCTTAVPVALANAIRLRQTFQEQSTDAPNPPADQRFIEVRVNGYVPDGGAATPTPTQPY